MSPWDVLVVAAKSVTYAATLGASGGVAFLIYCDSLVGPRDGHEIRRWLRAMAIVAALAGVVKWAALADSMSGDFTGMFDGDLGTMILLTGEGRALALRLIGLLLMTWSLTKPGRPAAPAALGALVAATSFGWTGHVHALHPATVPALLITAHLLGAAFWLGALMPLHRLARGAGAPGVAAAASRFGTAALGVVAVLLSAGLGMLCALLHHVSELWTTDYGRCIGAKMSAVAALLALAAFNHTRVTPRLSAGDFAAVTILRRSLVIEMSLACVILTVTAAMTTVTGPLL